MVNPTRWSNRLIQPVDKIGWYNQLIQIQLVDKPVEPTGSSKSNRLIQSVEQTGWSKSNRLTQPVESTG